MLEELKDMWDGDHGRVMATNHRTELISENGRSMRRAPYRTDSTPWRFSANELDWILQEDNTEATTTKLARSIVFVPKETVRFSYVSSINC